MLSSLLSGEHQVELEIGYPAGTGVPISSAGPENDSVRTAEY